MLPEVVVTDLFHDEMAPEHSVLEGIACVTALNAYGEDDVVARIPRHTQAIMLYHHTSIGRKTIDLLPRLKIVARGGVGYDNVDREYAASKGIFVTNVPDYGTEEVADSALGMLLSLTRGIHFLDITQRYNTQSWSFHPVKPLYRLRGKTLGLLGCGRIGQAMALRGKALGMRVVIYDPYQPDGLEKALGVERVERLQQLFEQSFVLSTHCCLTPETRHIVNGETIAVLPRGSFLINTARGGVVDTNAIPDAICSGHLAGAGIDVLEEEPPSATQPLVQAWRDPKHPCHARVILNPHAAFYCEEGIAEMRTKSALNCKRVLKGERPRNIVNGL